MDVDLHMTIDSSRAGSIKGEGENDTIGIENIAFDVKIGTSHDGSLSARRTYSDITIFKYVDSATVSFLSMLSYNDPIKKVKIFAKKSGGKQEVFYTIELNDARISSYQNLGYVDGLNESSGFVNVSHALGEKITINYARIMIEYYSQKADGSVRPVGSFRDDIKL